MTQPVVSPINQRLSNANGAFWGVLRSIASLAEAPLIQIAERLRDATLPYVHSSALVIFTEECTGRPQKKAGAEEIISRVSIAELDSLRTDLGTDGPVFREATLAGQTRSILALRYAPSRALLVLTDPTVTHPDDDSDLELLTYLWHLTASRIQEKVADAPPSYLLESRAASTERARVTAELTDLHSTTLENLLAALRSPSLDDAAARSVVIDLASKALVGLRSFGDRLADLAEEPVTAAFERLGETLKPIRSFSGTDIQFVPPPEDGRALPGEVAHASRSIVRGLVLLMMEQEQVDKIRIQWDCDGESLLINVRDDGAGQLDASSQTVQRLRRQAQALDGQLHVEVTPGWGTDVSAMLPLDPPALPSGEIAGWNLAAREIEVLERLAAGQRNRSIAMALNISENTVKFHVRNIFRKLNVGSRAEAVALAHSYGLR